MTTQPEKPVMVSDDSSVQPIVRYHAGVTFLQRIEVVAEVKYNDHGGLMGDYRVVHVNTPYRSSACIIALDKGDRIRQDYLDVLTFATPLEAVQSTYNLVADQLAHAELMLLGTEPNSTNRDKTKHVIENLKSTLVEVGVMLDRQANLSSKEWYWITDEYAIQLEQPMAANDETRYLMIGGQITYPMMAGYYTVLAGTPEYSPWFWGKVETFHNSIEEATAATLESIFPNEEDLGSKWIVTEIKNVLKMAEAAVLVKKLPVVALSPSKYVGKTYDQWYPFTRSNLCNDLDVESIVAWMRFGPPEIFEEAARLLRELA